MSPTAVEAAPVEVPVEQVAAKTTDVEDSTVGRIQVSAQRRRRFYVFVARRQFATKPEVETVVITALGSAIASAIATAGELVEMGVASITEVKTFYAPINAQVQRNVARIAITIKRNPEWKPEEADQKKPTRRNEEPAPESSE